MSLITHNGVFLAIRNLALKKKTVSTRLTRKYVVVLPMNNVFNSSVYTKVNYKIWIQENLYVLLEYKFKKYCSEAPCSVIMSLMKRRDIYSKENINKRQWQKNTFRHTSTYSSKFLITLIDKSSTADFPILLGFNKGNLTGSSPITITLFSSLRCSVRMATAIGPCNVTSVARGVKSSWNGN